MIFTKNNKYWADDLKSSLGFVNHWDELEKPLQKFICFAGGGGGPGGGGGGGGGGSDPFGDVDVEFGEPFGSLTAEEAIAATTGSNPGFGVGADDAPDPVDIEFGEPLPGMTATEAVAATSGAPAVGGLAGLAGTDYNPFPSILSFLGKLALAAIPVIGAPLAVASTVLSGLGTFGKAVGSKSLASLSEYSPINLVSNLFSKGLTSLGVPENVVDFVSAPPINVNTRPTTTDVSFFGIGRGTNNPAISAPFGTDVISDNLPGELTQGFSDAKSTVSGFVSDVEDFFTGAVEDNPIAVTPKATGGLVSLRDDGGPVISKAQEAYMNWLRSQGGPSALSKRALRQGRIDEVMTPAGPEYFKYNTGESSQAAFGETMYDDQPSDMDMFPFAYPENPNFRELNALGLRRPQPVNNKNTVDVIRKSIIARRRSEDEEERLRKLRRGIVSLMNEGGSIPERFTRADGRPFRPRFGEPGFNEKGVVTHAQQAYMDWLKAHGGPSALSKEGLRKGRIDEIDYGGDVGKIYFQYDPGDSSYSEVYGASMYDDDGDMDMFPFAYPEHPDFKLLNALGGGPKNLGQSVVPQNVVDVTRQSVIARRLSDEEEERLRRLRRGLPANVVNAVGAYTGGGIQQLVNQEPTLLDVVNKGMSIPEETIPSQRPEQFIKGQQQPGGLRSTNYYTNAMQPASFYAQPQQVRNYGSIY